MSSPQIERVLSRAFALVRSVSAFQNWIGRPHCQTGAVRLQIQNLALGTMGGGAVELGTVVVAGVVDVVLMAAGIEFDEVFGIAAVVVVAGGVVADTSVANYCY